MRRLVLLLAVVVVCLPAAALGRKKAQRDDLLLIVAPTGGRAIASAHPHVNVIVRFGALSTGVPADPATFSARLGRLDITSQFTPIVEHGATVGVRAELLPDQLRTGRGRRNRLKMYVSAMAVEGGTDKRGRPFRDKDKVRFRAEERPNQPPVAIAFTSSRLLLPGNPIHFDSAESHDPDGDVITYDWNFGDGVTSTDQATSHVFADTEADVDVQLTVNDGQNDGVATVLLRTCPMPAAGFEPGFLEVTAEETLEFGPVPAGTAVTRTFTVRNADEPGTTTIGACVGVGSRDGAFTVTPEEFMLEGGESREVTLTFTPSAEGHSDATLTVVGSARERPIVTFLTHGYGGAGAAPSGPTLAPQPFFYSDIVPDLFGLGIYHVRTDGTETLVDNGVNTCEVPQFGLGTGDVCVENRDCASNGGTCATVGTCLGGLNAGGACSVPQDCPEGFCPAYTLFDPVQMCGDGEGGLYVLSDEGTYTDPTFETGTELSISVLSLGITDEGATSDRKILDRVATETTQMACDGFPRGSGRVYLAEFQEIDLGNNCFRSEKERLLTLRKNDGTRQTVMGRIDAAAGIPECGDDGDIDPVLHLETSADGADTFVSFETSGLWRVRPTSLQFLTGDDNFLNEELFRLHPDGDLLYTTTTNGPTSSVINLFKISADQVAGGPVPLDALTPCAVYQVPNNGYVSDDGLEELRGSSAVIAFDAAPAATSSLDATVLVNFASGASNLHPAHLSTDLAIRGTVAFRSPAGSTTCEVLGLTNLRVLELLTF